MKLPELENHEEFIKYLSNTLIYGTAFIKDGKVLDINDVYLDGNKEAKFVRDRLSPNHKEKG